MNEFCYFKERILLFSSYLDSSVFDESRNFKICDVMVDIIDYFFRARGNIKMKFGQTLQFMKNQSQAPLGFW